MKQQKKIAKSNVGVTAFGDSHHNGITLISLVITVVVLLILAGVAIIIALNPEGVFGKSEQAKTDWNNSVAKEQSSLNSLLGLLGIKQPTNLIGSTVTQESTVAGVTKERTAPIPVGYMVSGITSTINATNPEDTIEGGLVIYEIPEGATVDWEKSEVVLAEGQEPVNLQENVNQYVWIPVDDINSMIMCKSNNKLPETGTDSKICDVKIVNGILKCTNPAHTNTTTDLCGRLYNNDNYSTTDTTTPISFTVPMNFNDNTQIWDANSNREPAVLDGGRNAATIYEATQSFGIDMSTLGLTTVADLGAQLQKDFCEMATSVAINGGFYVARYETGAILENSEIKNVISQKNKDVVTSAYVDGDIQGPNYIKTGSWYGIYNAIRNKSVTSTSPVKSHMIWR